MKIVLLGPPGSGKGTQAAELTARLGIPVVSTGYMLRAEIARRSDVGLKAEAIINSGRLVPDDVVLEMLEDRLSRPDCQKGYILDGFPRNVPQAEALEKLGIELDAALFFDVSDDVIVERMCGRRVCPACGETYHVRTRPPETEGVCGKCGAALIIRGDDAADTVLKRLETYHENTEPLLSYYSGRGKLKTVAHADSIKGVTSNMMSVLESMQR